MITEALQRIANRPRIAHREEARAVMTEIFSGSATDAQIAALLVALHMKGETVEEIVGFAEAIRAAAEPLPIHEDATAGGQRHWARCSGGHLRHRRRRQPAPSISQPLLLSWLQEQACAWPNTATAA